MRENLVTKKTLQLAQSKGFNVIQRIITVYDENTPEETQLAHEKIGRFAKQFGLTLANTRGKHMEFIYQNYPEHYQNLVKAGIMDK